MASHAEASDPGHVHAPQGRMPHVPEVHDEAANTPAWIPLLGLGLLALAAFYGVYRSATSEEPPGEGEITAEGAAAAVAADENKPEEAGAQDAPPPTPPPAPPQPQQVPMPPPQPPPGAQPHQG